MEASDAAVKEANQSEEEPEIVTDEDENRKVTAAETLKKPDEVKNFIEINGSYHLNMIFNEFRIQKSIKRTPRYSGRFF